MTNSCSSSAWKWYVRLSVEYRNSHKADKCLITYFIKLTAYSKLFKYMCVWHLFEKVILLCHSKTRLWLRLHPTIIFQMNQLTDVRNTEKCPSQFLGHNFLDFKCLVASIQNTKIFSLIWNKMVENRKSSWLRGWKEHFLQCFHLKVISPVIDSPKICQYFSTCWLTVVALYVTKLLWHKGCTTYRFSIIIAITNSQMCVECQSKAN